MLLAIFGSKIDIMRNLKYSIFLFGVAAFVSCSDEVLSDHSSPFLNGSEKTPLSVTALLASGSQSQTRASDMSFDNGDEFVAYLRHVTWDGSTGDRTSVTADKAPLLVTFTKGNTDMSAYTTEIKPIGLGGNVGLGISTTNTQQASDLTTSTSLYWDDFSNSASADKDLRTDGHYLESYYGYCYNGSPVYGESGSSITTNLVEETGVLGWTVSADQDVVPTGTEKSNFQKSDLLWSAEQTPVQYTHTVDGRPSLILPYTHAMSKVTIEIVLNEGFDVYPTGNANAGKAKAFGDNVTTPTLFANRVTTTTAPTYTHSTTVATGSGAEIKMRLATEEVVTNGVSNKTRVYEAIIAPTVMKAGQKLAEVTVDGNRYDIGLTDAILNPTSGSNTWSSMLKGYSLTDSDTKVSKSTGDYSAENGGITLAGVNYRIKVELNKQKSGVTAYITNWSDVTASTTGTISFNADVVTSEVKDGATEVASGSFDLWRATVNSAETDYDNVGTTADVIDRAATYTYSSDKWVGEPTIYWENGATQYYFRALANVASYDSDGKVTGLTAPSKIDGATASSIVLAKQDQDLLWAQTSKHEVKDANDQYIPHPSQAGEHKLYEAGAAIDPRTGDVPLTFQHAMSKISVTLATTTGDDQVENLSSATMSIINLYDGGTISVKDGTISNRTFSNGSEPMTIKDKNVTDMSNGIIVIPQSLVKMDDADKTDRDQTPTFYSSEELTGIYSDGTSRVPSIAGTPTYYLTTDLSRVDAVLYTDEDYILEYNAKLPGAKSTDDVKKQATYYDNFQEYQDLEIYQKTDLLTSDIFTSLIQTDEAKDVDERIWVKEYKYYTTSLDDLKSFLTNLNEAMFDKLPSEFKQKEENVPYTYTEFTSLKDNISESDGLYSKWGILENKYKIKEAVSYEYEDLQSLESSKFTAAMYSTLPLEAKIKDREVMYTADEVKEINSKLDGALHLNDVKEPAYYMLPSVMTGVAPHEPGSIDKRGNKVMLYIYLDGTRYSADLSKCTIDGTTSVPEWEWEGGKHYKYTITLYKSKLELRALVKNWEDYEVGGNATLDWD